MKKNSLKELIGVVLLCIVSIGVSISSIMYLDESSNKVVNNASNMLNALAGDSIEETSEAKTTNTSTQETSKKEETTSKKNQNTTKKKTTTTTKKTTQAKPKNLTEENKDKALALANKNTSTAKQVLSYVNAYRKEKGLKPVTIDNKLSTAASIRAYELHMKWSHTRPDGRKWDTVIYDLKYTGGRTIIGENLGYGQTSAKEISVDWYNSESHRKNLLNPRFTKMGIALVKINGVWYWAQMFSD